MKSPSLTIGTESKAASPESSHAPTNSRVSDRMRLPQVSFRTSNLRLLHRPTEPYCPVSAASDEIFRDGKGLNRGVSSALGAKNVESRLCPPQIKIERVTKAGDHVVEVLLAAGRVALTSRCERRPYNCYAKKLVTPPESSLTSPCRPA